MGEIKSTLELIMEKTRHMTLTEEEKQEHAKAELLVTLKALIQKFENGVLDLREFGSEYNRALKTSGVNEPGLLREELLRRLDLRKDNTRILTLLREVCSVSTSNLLALLEEYEKAVLTASEGRSRHKIEELCADRGVSGSALVPNLEADSAWRQDRERLTEQYRRKLAEEASLLGV